MMNAKAKFESTLRFLAIGETYKSPGNPQMLNIAHAFALIGVMESQDGGQTNSKVLENTLNNSSFALQFWAWSNLAICVCMYA